jgi:hypothetical protein
MEVADTPNMQIASSCITGPDAAGDYVVTMKVANLGSLSVPPTEGGPDAIWLTRWELPNPNPSVADQGHVFYVAMESDNGGPPSFYAGETQSIAAVPGSSSGQGFFLTYPPEETITGSYTPGSPGTITIDVPAADVGNPSASLEPLYSVTGLTATQAEPSTLSGTLVANVFNLIDASNSYDAG